MKKVLRLGIIVFFVICIFGCQKKADNQKKVTCYQRGITENGVAVSYTYKITSEDDIVKLVQSEEKITSMDKTLLEDYKEKVERLYSEYSDIEHYHYNVQINGTVLLSTVKIDYSKINVEEMAKINPSISIYMSEGNLKLEDLISIYESSGNVCRED